MNATAFFSTTDALTTAAGSLLLAYAAYEDFRARRFPNRAFLAASLAGVALSVATAGLSGLQQSALGLAGGFALLMPLTLMGAVGAGDMKLLAAFGSICGWVAAAETLLFGFVWGAVFGVAHAALNGQALALARNVARIAGTRSSQGVALHRIPFAGALLLGFFAHLAYRGLA